ncbi:hypothetical protein QUB70_10405 [Microcoleus sp. A003_D6]|uniref:hypothetical protein n=1 Tax=Microcoleus sp. A003_D6 TaxID=3055266 RepID=UPI002FD226FF
MPVPQENSLFVEQAGKPVAYNGARCLFEPRYGKAIQDRNQPALTATKGEIKILNFFIILLITNN